MTKKTRRKFKQLLKSNLINKYGRGGGRCDEVEINRSNELGLNDVCGWSVNR